MSVISTYTARVTISVFITVIALLENTSNGQSHEQNFFYYRHNDRISSYSSRDEGGSSSSIFPKDHVPDIGDTSQSDAKEIPMEFFEQLNNVTDVDEFIQKFIDKDDEGLSKYGSVMFERSAGTHAKAASCEPTMQVVPLEPFGSSNTDPDVYYFPKCTRMKQCNGCCNSPALVCTPVETQELSLTVLKLRYKTSGSKVLGKEPISVQEHIRCECQCRVKQEHCNAYQRYDSSHCKCVCKNKDEKDKCQSEVGKIWDHTNCSCGCRNEVPCTTGSFFNQQTCKCEENENTPKFGTLDRKRFILKATPVVQDNSTLYDTTDN